jgi:adenylosuccinate lyase
MLHQRYTSIAMREVWSDDSRYRRWRVVELAVLHARAALGEIGSDIVAAAEAAPMPSPAAVEEAEAVTRHDLVAFLTVWRAGMPDRAADWVHRGLTSSDTVDTALALTVQAASDLLLVAADDFVAALRDHALVHRRTLRLGRTHGQAAVPETWGHRFADFAFAAARSRGRLRAAREAVSIGKISGPTGTYANLDPRIEQLAAARLDLIPTPVATQVVARDCLAEWTFALSMLASVAESVALEIRHCQRFEVSEVAEPVTPEQSGSSAMPHKRNPVRSEKVCGLARVVRSLVLPVAEGIALWHERDISHSSVERICLPEAAALTEHALTTMTDVIRNLLVSQDQMRSTLHDAGAVVASDVILSLLIERGLSQAMAYELLKRASRQVDPGGFEAAVRSEASAVGVTLPPDDFAELAINLVLTSVGLSQVFDRLEALMPTAPKQIE